jgi:NAD(P)-dependent dehydrogenase (short-subunit alcohol dehydrogenase family)
VTVLSTGIRVVVALSIVSIVAALLIRFNPFAAPKTVKLPAPSAHPATNQTVVITGANRGLGLAFARQLHVDGATVIATARHPEKAKALHELGVEVIKLDVTKDEDVAGLAAAIGDRSVDMLINNAGITGTWVSQIDKIDPQGVAKVLDVNLIGPMRVTKALLPALRRGTTRRIVNISSWLGSLTRATKGGGSYGYRESKAALNMFTKAISIELRDESFTCIAMNPGAVVLLQPEIIKKENPGLIQLCGKQT